MFLFPTFSTKAGEYVLADSNKRYTSSYTKFTAASAMIKQSKKHEFISQCHKAARVQPISSWLLRTGSRPKQKTEPESYRAWLSRNLDHK